MLSSEGERHDTHSCALPPLSHRPGHEGWHDQSAHLKHDQSVVKILLTQAGGPCSIAPYHDNLLGTRERRACAPEGEPPRARGTGDCGPANAASPALVVCRWTCTARDRGQHGKAAHGMCAPLPRSSTAAQARHALTVGDSARAAVGGRGRELRPSVSVNPATPWACDRCTHLETKRRLIPTMAATEDNTLPRRARPPAMVVARCHARSVWRAAGVRRSVT
jgi:hypothetical protein